MEVSRQAIAKALATVFVFNLIVMGGGAIYSAQQVPPIPQEVVAPGATAVVSTYRAGSDSRSPSR